MSLWKNLLAAVLAITIPVLYSWLIRAVPDIPLPSNIFSELILWAVGYLIGGWQATKAYIKNALNKFGAYELSGRTVIFKTK